MAKSPKKEAKKKVILISITILVAIIGVLILSQFKSPITGFAIIDQGPITTETVNANVGDTVIYTAVSGFFELGCSDINCDGSISGDTLTIPASAVDSNCVCDITNGFTTHVVTLNIQAANSCNPSASCTGLTSGALASDPAGPPPQIVSGDPPSDPDEDTA